MVPVSVASVTSDNVNQGGRIENMANPSLTPAPTQISIPQLTPVQAVPGQQQLSQAQGKIITVPGIPGHFIQVLLRELSLLTSIK